MPWRSSNSATEADIDVSVHTAHLEVELNLITPRPVSERFVGRDGCLRELHEYLSAPQTSEKSRIVVLHGMGGQGKTQMAVKYIKDHQLEYQHVIWIDGTSKLTAQKSFIEAAAIFGSGTGGDKNPEESIYAVLEILRAFGREATWLLVFDNLDDPDETYMNQVASWIPHARFGSVIITTRLRTWQIDGAKTIGISSLSKADAMQLLRMWVGPVDDEESEKIVTRLGCLALAVNQAGAFISKEVGVDVGQYLEYYDEVRKELLQYGPQHAAEWDYWKFVDGSEIDRERTASASERLQPASVMSTWELSFRRLENRHPDAAKLLTLMSFFDRTSFTVDLILRGASTNKRLNYEGVLERVRPSAAGVSQWLIDLLDGKSPRGQTIQINFLMNRLMDYSLVQCASGKEEQSSTSQRFWIHPLVHDWARIRLKQTDSVVVGVQAVSLVSHALEDFSQFLYLEDNNSSLLPHVDFSSPTLLGLISDATLGLQEHARLLQVAYRFGSLYRAHNRFDQADKLLGTVWTHLKQGLDQSALETALKDIDLIMAPSADSPCRDKVSWRAANNLSKIQIHDLVPLIHSMAISYFHQGKVQSASSLISVLTEIQDEESEAQRKCLCRFETIRTKSMICLYRREISESETLAREAYEGFKAILGHGNPRTLFACTGYLYTLMSNPSRRTAELARRTAIEFERIAGAEATITRYAQCLSNIICLQHQDPDAAINEWRAMLELSTKMGTFSYDARIPILDEPTLRIMTELGWAKIASYIKHEKEAQPPVELLTEARDLGERAFRGCKEVLPFISAYASLLTGEAYYYNENLNQAEEWFRTTIDLVQGEGYGTLDHAKYRLEEIATLRQQSKE